MPERVLSTTVWGFPNISPGIEIGPINFTKVMLRHIRRGYWLVHCKFRLGAEQISLDRHKNQVWQLWHKTTCDVCFPYFILQRIKYRLSPRHRYKVSCGRQNNNPVCWASYAICRLGTKRASECWHLLCCLFIQRSFVRSASISATCGSPMRGCRARNGPVTG